MLIATTITAIMSVGIVTYIHECLIIDGGSTCHEQAICSNEPGGYTCTCNTGFTGNGSFCELGQLVYGARYIVIIIWHPQRILMNVGAVITHAVGMLSVPMK